MCFSLLAKVCKGMVESKGLLACFVLPLENTAAETANCIELGHSQFHEQIY